MKAYKHIFNLIPELRIMISKYKAKDYKEGSNLRVCFYWDGQQKVKTKNNSNKLLYISYDFFDGKRNKEDYLTIDYFLNELMFSYYRFEKLEGNWLKYKEALNNNFMLDNHILLKLLQRDLNNKEKINTFFSEEQVELLKEYYFTKYDDEEYYLYG